VGHPHVNIQQAANALIVLEPADHATILKVAAICESLSIGMVTVTKVNALALRLLRVHWGSAIIVAGTLLTSLRVANAKIKIKPSVGNVTEESTLAW
jgi:hypothetical protein